MDQQAVIKGCIVNNRKAQEQLYRCYFDRMYAMVTRYTGQDEDRTISILNDGFLKVFKNIASFQNQGSLEGWIRKIVYRSLSDYYRKENRYLKFLILEEAEKPVSEHAINTLYYDDLMKMVERLPDATKQVFHLYAIEGYTHKEIGELLHISDGTSKWHLSQARKQLKAMIMPHYKIKNH